MANPRMTLEELLLRHRAIDEDQLKRAREEQARLGGELGRVLLDLGYITEELLVRAQSHQLGIPAVKPDKETIPPELLRAFPAHLCEKFGVVPVGGNLANKMVRVATASPGNTELLASLAHESGFHIETAVATAASIERAIKRNYFGEEVPPELEPEAADDAGDLSARVERLEQSLANPQVAALLARIERLEQIAEADRRGLRALSKVMIDLGFISDEELRKRLKGVS
jgi:type IV pilus assembly protein PilB